MCNASRTELNYSDRERNNRANCKKRTDESLG